jgi:hypothetical protein
MIKELAEETRCRAEVPTDRARIGYNAFRCWMTIGYRWLCSRISIVFLKIFLFKNILK